MTRTGMREAQRELEAITFLKERGYIVNLGGPRNLSFHRTEPFPPEVDFNQEALENLRSQLTVNHIHFSKLEHPAEPWPGGRKAFIVHSARLYFL